MTIFFLIVFTLVLYGFLKNLYQWKMYEIQSPFEATSRAKTFPPICAPHMMFFRK